LGGGTCYDLVNAYACLCPDRVFRPQCNTTAAAGITTLNIPSNPVLITSSNCKLNEKNSIKNYYLYFVAKSSNNNNAAEQCPCRNGGTCTSTQANGQVCQCPKGFSGTFCETAICKKEIED